MPAIIENEITYARHIGSSETVFEGDWNRNGPFGHCPACGSLGIEDGPSVEMEYALFRCSDEICYTRFYEERDTADGFEPIVGVGAFRTQWSEKKPVEWWNKEIEEGASWNWSNFSTEFCTANELV